MARTTASGIVLLEDLNLHNARRKSMLELEDALADSPEIALTMEGACTLTLTVADARRKLITSPLVQEKSWSEVAGIRFELVALRKAGDRVTMTYEDGVTAALRRRDTRMVIRGNTMTRSGVFEKLADEAGVKHTIDPGKGRGKVHNPVRRSTAGERKTNSWDLGRELAEEVHWRSFSTGHRWIAGADDWLLEDDKPVRLHEHTGAVHDIDFDLDVGKRLSAATVLLDATIGAVPPGQLVVLGDDAGPAEGRWLTRTFRRRLSSTQATLELTRARHELKEPKRSGAGDSGEPDYLPGVGDGTDTGGAATAARAKMVAFALAQNGDAYYWGGSGPDAWDCSGLVEAATAAAGNRLAGTAATQAAAMAGAGKTMSLEQAANTRGAIFSKVGVSSYNHTAISLGNGQTIEAMGSAYGVCIGSAAGRGWTQAGWWV